MQRPSNNPPVVQPGSGNNIIINPCQRGNPILACIRNVGKEYAEIAVDYQVGKTTGVLYLRLHPEYIHQRIEKLGTSYGLRILLVECDVTEHQEPIREITKICLLNNITVLVAWTKEEAGFYLTTLKQSENRPPDLIKERVDKDYDSILRTALTSISKVNKTDVETLRTSLGSIVNISTASSDTLQNLPGFGQVKVRRLKDAFEKPFRTIQSQSAPHNIPRVPEASTTTQSVDDTSSSTVQGTREPSPVWDIELDLNEMPSP